MKQVAIALLALTAFSVMADVSQNPLDQLLGYSRNGVVFRQTTKELRCPELINVFEEKTDNKKEKVVYLSAASENDKGGFPHSAAYLFKSGLKENKKHVIKRSLKPVLFYGSFNSSKQSVVNGVLILESKAKLGGLTGSMRTDSKLEFDALSDTIKYSFSGNGIKDIQCEFEIVEKECL